MASSSSISSSTRLDWDSVVCWKSSAGRKGNGGIKRKLAERRCKFCVGSDNVYAKDDKGLKEEKSEEIQLGERGRGNMLQLFLEFLRTFLASSNFVLLLQLLLILVSVQVAFKAPYPYRSLPWQLTFLNPHLLLSFLCWCSVVSSLCPLSHTFCLFSVVSTESPSWSTFSNFSPWLSDDNSRYVKRVCTLWRHTILINCHFLAHSFLKYDCVASLLVGGK